jgi:hypothetical protein
VSDLSARIRELAATGLDEDQITEQLLGEVRKLAELRALVTPVLRARVFRYLRERTRTTEKRVWGSARQLVDGAESVDSVEAMRDLSNSTFALPDGRFVAWLDATADDHLARAGWQRGLAAAVVEDAERHEKAAAMIEEAGVSRLRDLLDRDDEEGDAA